MQIGGLQKLTLIDYPGKIACTVFLIGCNYRCGYCYNPELVLPEAVKEHPRISEKDFFNFLGERKNFLDGVCMGGGEPCINGDLPQFCQKIKKLGYLIKIDTNGSEPEMLKKLIEKKLIDYVAIDIKAPKEKYNLVCGKKVDIKKVEKSIGILKKNEVNYEFRTTLIPTLLLKEDIIKIARWIGPAKKYFLQNFMSERTINPKFEKIKPYPNNYLLEIQKAISSFFETCQVRQ